MGSVGNSDPWAPYDGYRDCSQGICNEYCPQWCYIIFSPPPPASKDDSGTDFSPLILAIIGILASAFLLVIYFTVISKYCRRRRGRRTSAEENGNQDEMVNDQPLQVASTGLEEAFIKSIRVYKYKKSGGVVEGTDCSVCLSEFEDGENLRLLPKCNHAFHLPCIDTWLKSHSSCPLCRFDIRSAKILPPELSEATQGVPPNIRVSALEVQSGNRSLLIIHDLESGTIRREAVVRVEVTDETPKATSEVHRGMENSAGRESIIEIRQEGLLRRSISFDSSCEAHVAIPDILHSSEDHSLCFPMENMNEREAMPVTMRRSISTGRFMPLRHGKRSPCVFPN